MKRIIPVLTGEIDMSKNVPAVYAKAGKLSDIETIRKMSVGQMEKLLSTLAAEIYLRGGQRLTPVPPFILVRVIPKEMATAGGIILPDERQNKPVAEGIVLETYAPYVEEVLMHMRDDQGNITGDYYGKVTRECPVKVGDRVIFPYYEGVKHKLLGDDYLLIRQAADQIKFPYCQVLGTLDYEGDVILQTQIVDLMKRFRAITISGAAVSKGA